MVNFKLSCIIAMSRLENGVRMSIKYQVASKDGNTTEGSAS